MGRTNIVIDETLVQRAIKITGAKSKREAVNIALRQLVENSSLLGSLRKLKGKLNWQGDLGRMRKSRV